MKAEITGREVRVSHIIFISHFEACRIHCVKLVQELSGAGVSDKLDKLSFSGETKHLL